MTEGPLMNPYPFWLVRIKADYLAYVWKLGLIKRTTALRWEVDRMLYPFI